MEQLEILMAKKLTMIKTTIHLVAILLCFSSMLFNQATAQNNKKMSKENNLLLCNPDSGLCALPERNTSKVEHNGTLKQIKPITILYFTDPICSSCWGIEPQLRKLKLEYGDAISIEYKMGGLLPDWSYNSGGISKPSDVAHHWDEVSVHYDMPIDGDVWLTDPLPSSYPPSIAFKAAQMQNHTKAIAFLRVIREMVFLQKKNIAKWEHLQSAAQQVGLNVQQFEKDYNGAAKNLFQEDLDLAQSWKVRGFPTMFFVDSAGKSEIVYGSKPYASYEQALKLLYPLVQKQPYNKSWDAVFAVYPTLTANEFAVLTQIDRAAADMQLQALSKQGLLQILSTKNGSLYIKPQH